MLLDLFIVIHVDRFVPELSLADLQEAVLNRHSLSCRGFVVDFRVLLTFLIILRLAFGVQLQSLQPQKSLPLEVRVVVWTIVPALLPGDRALDPSVAYSH